MDSDIVLCANCQPSDELILPDAVSFDFTDLVVGAIEETDISNDGALGSDLDVVSIVDAIDEWRDPREGASSVSWSYQPEFESGGSILEKLVSFMSRTLFGHCVEHSVLTPFTPKSPKTHFYAHQNYCNLTHSNRKEIYCHLH